MVDETVVGGGGAAKGTGIIMDQLWGGKCVDRVLSEPR